MKHVLIEMKSVFVINTVLKPYHGVYYDLSINILYEVNLLTAHNF